MLLEEIAKNHEGEQTDEYTYARLLGLWRVAAWEDPKVRSWVAELSTKIETSNSVELKRAIELAADRLTAPAIGVQKTSLCRQWRDTSTAQCCIQKTFQTM